MKFFRKSDVKSLYFQICMIIALLAAMFLFVSVYMVSGTVKISDEYDKVDNSIVISNRIISNINDIEDKSYFVAIGHEGYSAKSLVTMYNHVQNYIDTLNTFEQTSESRLILNQIERSVQKLYDTILLLEKQETRNLIREHKIQTYRQIYYNCQTTTELVTGYIYTEITKYEDLNSSLHERTDKMIVLQVFFVILVLIIVVFLLQHIVINIINPIKNLVTHTEKISKGEFTEIKNINNAVSEISILQGSFNSMTVELDSLLDKIYEDAKKKKVLELRLLQEQINPHFLYNTLEMIVWMAESGNHAKIIEIVKSMSQFFRLVLSDGQENVKIYDEINCIKNYLFLQSVRYGDIMDYDVQIEKELYQYTLPKLTLQPIVENALYHGLKMKRGSGVINICVYEYEGCLVIDITDNGVGMNEETLKMLQQSLLTSMEENTISNKGFGLINVHRRIQLYYGNDYGLQITSKKNVGTNISITIPIN